MITRVLKHFLPFNLVSVCTLMLLGCASFGPQIGDGRIGIQVEDRGGQWYVAKVVENGAVYRAGQLSEGDLLVAVAELRDEPQPVSGMSLNELASRISGEPGTAVDLVIKPANSEITRKVTITRARFGSRETAQPEMRQNAEARLAAGSLVIEGTSGNFMSPYTSDGVTAEWVNKAINANIGSTVGSGVGAAAGAYAAEQALDSVPFGGFIGGMIGSSLGKSVGRDAAIEASGGWDYIRSTSDQSFRSLADMARYLTLTYGNEPTFNEAMAAAAQVYPELSDALANY